MGPPPVLAVDPVWAARSPDLAHLLTAWAVVPAWAARPQDLGRRPTVWVAHPPDSERLLTVWAVGPGWVGLPPDPPLDSVHPRADWARLPRAAAG